MSNKKILNKKYIFLQNLFYQSIPISLPENNKDTILNSLKKTRRVSGPSKGGFAPLRSPWGQNMGKAHKKILYPKDLSLLKLINPFLNNKKNPLLNVSLLTIKRTPKKMARTNFVVPLQDHKTIAPILKDILKLKGHKNKNFQKSSHKIGGGPDGHIFDDKTNLSTYGQSPLTWSYFYSFSYKKANKSFFKLSKKLEHPLNRGDLFLNWEKSIFQIQNIYYGPFITHKIGALLNGKTILNGASLKYLTPGGVKDNSFLGFAHKNPYTGLSKGGKAPLNQTLNNNLKNAQLGWPTTNWENTANYEIKLQNTKDELKVSMGLRNITHQIGGGPLLNVFKKYLPLYFSTKKYIAKTMPESQSIFRFRDIGKAHGQFNKTLPYKKSFFCYWLLPFMGFVSCFPALPQPLRAMPARALETSFLNSPTALSTFNLWSSSEKDLENKATIGTPPGGVNPLNTQNFNFSNIKYLKNQSIQKYSFSYKKENQVLDSIKKLYNFYYEDLEKSIQKSISEVSPSLSKTSEELLKGGPQINNCPISPSAAIKGFHFKEGPMPLLKGSEPSPKIRDFLKRGANAFTNPHNKGKAHKKKDVARKGSLQEKKDIQLSLPRTQLLEKLRIKEASFKATWFSSKLTIVPQAIRGHSYLKTTFNKGGPFLLKGRALKKPLRALGHDFSYLWGIHLKNVSPLIGLSDGPYSMGFAHNAGHYLPVRAFGVILKGGVQEGFYYRQCPLEINGPEPISKNPPLKELPWPFRVTLKGLGWPLFISREHNFRYNGIVFARKLEKDLYGTPQGGGRLTNLEFKKISKTNSKVEPIILPLNITFKEIHNSNLLHFKKGPLFTLTNPPAVKSKGKTLTMGKAHKKKDRARNRGAFTLKGSCEQTLQLLNCVWGANSLKEASVAFFLECDYNFETPRNSNAISSFKKASMILDGLLGPSYEDPATKIVSKLDHWIKNYKPATTISNDPSSRGHLNSVIYLEQNAKFRTPSFQRVIKSTLSMHNLFSLCRSFKQEDAKLYKHWPQTQIKPHLAIFQEAPKKTLSGVEKLSRMSLIENTIFFLTNKNNFFSEIHGHFKKGGPLKSGGTKIEDLKKLQTLLKLCVSPPTTINPAPLGVTLKGLRHSFAPHSGNALTPFRGYPKGVTNALKKKDKAPYRGAFSSEKDPFSNSLARVPPRQDRACLQNKGELWSPLLLNPTLTGSDLNGGVQKGTTRQLIYKLNKDSFYYLIFSGNIRGAKPPLEAFFQKDNFIPTPLSNKGYAPYIKGIGPNPFRVTLKGWVKNKPLLKIGAHPYLKGGVPYSFKGTVNSGLSNGFIPLIIGGNTNSNFYSPPCTPYPRGVTLKGSFFRGGPKGIPLANPPGVKEHFLKGATAKSWFPLLFNPNALKGIGGVKKGTTRQMTRFLFLDKTLYGLCPYPALNCLVGSPRDHKRKKTHYSFNYKVHLGIHPISMLFADYPPMPLRRKIEPVIEGLLNSISPLNSRLKGNLKGYSLNDQVHNPGGLIACPPSLEMKPSYAYKTEKFMAPFGGVSKDVKVDSFSYMGHPPWGCPDGVSPDEVYGKTKLPNQKFSSALSHPSTGEIWQPGKETITRLWSPLLFNPLIPPPNNNKKKGGGWYGVKKGTTRQMPKAKLSGFSPLLIKSLIKGPPFKKNPPMPLFTGSIFLTMGKAHSKGFHPILPPPLIRKALKGSALRGLRGGGVGKGIREKIEPALKISVLNVPLLTIKRTPFKMSRPIKGVLWSLFEAGTAKASFIKTMPPFLNLKGCPNKYPIPTFNRGHLFKEGKDIFNEVLLKGLTPPALIRALPLKALGGLKDHSLWAKPEPLFQRGPLKVKGGFEVVALKMTDKATINTQKKRLLLKKAQLIKLNNTETLWANPGPNPQQNWAGAPLILKGGLNLKGGVIRQFIRSRVAKIPIIKAPPEVGRQIRVLNYSFSYMLKFYRTNNIGDTLKRGKNVKKYLKLDNFVGKDHSLGDCISSESHGLIKGVDSSRNNNQVLFTPDKAEKLLTSYLSTKNKSWDTLRGAKPPLEDFIKGPPFKKNPQKNSFDILSRGAYLKLSTEQIQIIDFKYLQIQIVTPNFQNTFKEKPIIQTKNFGGPHLGVKLSRFYLRFFWDTHSPFSSGSNTWLEETIGSGFVGHPRIQQGASLRIKNKDLLPGHPSRPLNKNKKGAEPSGPSPLYIPPLNKKGPLRVGPNPFRVTLKGLGALGGVVWGSLRGQGPNPLGSIIERVKFNKFKKGGPFITPHFQKGGGPGKDYKAINYSQQYGLTYKLIRQLSIFNLSPNLLIKNRFFIKKPLNPLITPPLTRRGGVGNSLGLQTAIMDNAHGPPIAWESPLGPGDRLGHSPIEELRWRGGETMDKTYKTGLGPCPNKKKDILLKAPLNMGDALTLNNFYKGSIGYLDFDPILRQTSFMGGPRNQKIELSKYISFLEQKKYAEKKHRKNKQKNQTTRRKKRKRGYPRPIWHRSQLYEKFIKLRHMPSKQSRFKVGFNRPLIWAGHPHFKKGGSSMSGVTPTFKSGSPFHFQPLFLRRALPGSFPQKNKSISPILPQPFRVTLKGLGGGLEKGNKKIYRNYKAAIPWGPTTDKNNLAYNNHKSYVPHGQPWPLWFPYGTTRQPGGLYKQPVLGDLSQNFQVYRFNGNSSNYYGSIIGEKNLKMLSQLIMSYSHTKKNFYEISRPTLSELRKSFWKSYWLRSNLNPYLKRVKLYFKELRDTNLNTKKSIFLNYNIKSVLSKKTLSLRKREINKLEGFSPSLKDNSFEILNSMPGNKWQIATNVRQYHLIVYERLQQIILNIRGNLGINGQPKPRAYKLGCRKLPTPKPIKEFWIKLGKAITFELPGNSFYGQSPYGVNFSGDISKLRRIWALNRSNLSYFKAINQRKNLWLTGKIRTQSHSNQTLKAIYKILPSIKPSNNRFNEPSFAGDIGALAKGATPRDIGHIGAGGIAPIGSDILNRDYLNVAPPIPDSKGGLLLSLKLQNFFKTFQIYSIGTPPGVTSIEGTFKAQPIKSPFMGKPFAHTLDQSSNSNLERYAKEYIRSININQYKLRKKENKLAYLGFLTKKTNKLSLSALRDFKLRTALNGGAHLKSKKTLFLKTVTPLNGGHPYLKGHSFSYRKGFDVLNGVLFKKGCNTDISINNSLAQLNLTFLNKFTTQYNYWWNLFPIKRIPDFSPPPIFKVGHSLKGSPTQYFKANPFISPPLIRKGGEWYGVGKGIGESHLRQRQILSLNGSHFACGSLTGPQDNGTPPYYGGWSVWASTFLFHLCAFLFLINSSEIRGLIKFQMIFFSIAMKIYLNIAKKTSFWIKGVVEEKGLGPTGYHTITNIFLKGFDSSKKHSPFGRITPGVILGGNQPPLFKRPPLFQEGLAHKETLRGTGMAVRTDYLNTLQTINPLLPPPKVHDKKGGGWYGVNKTKTFFCKEILNGDLIKAKPPLKTLGGGHTFFIGISANSRKGSTNKFTSVYRLSFKGHPFHTKIAQIYLSLLNTIIKSNLHETIKFDIHQGSPALGEVSEVITEVTKFVLFSCYKVGVWFYINLLTPGGLTLVTPAIDIFQNIVGFIYLFFEKPGELLGEWIGYGFLVDWSSDLITTIPESNDLLRMNISSKIARGVRPFIMGYYGVLLLSFYNLNQVCLWVPPLIQQSTNSVFISFPLLMGSASLLNRRILHMYETILEKWWEPDTDLLIRQKKGIIFWDFWSEVLIDVAENSNINISELSLLTEEQNRLLEKLEVYSAPRPSLRKKIVFNPAYFKYSLKPVRALGDFKEMVSSVLPGANFYFKIGVAPILFRKPYYLCLSTVGSAHQSQDSLSFNPPGVAMPLFFGGEKIPPLVLSQGSQEPAFKYRANKGGPLKENLNPVMGKAHTAMGKKDHTAITPSFKKNPLLINKNWSVNQFLSYQGKDTQLFIQKSPPKSFAHISAMKYSQSAHEPIGSAVCQIFSGIFNKQRAKNILVVGSSGTKNDALFIQSIAGETELKIIIDNAQRYSLVHSGVAIGIKLLKDVFEALSLHTPCIFLLEDIHHIGGRRPLLLSDQSTMPGGEFSFKAPLDEKNQVTYELSKHLVNDYKKPYKGDFSLLIPTNHFCFNLFLGVSSAHIRPNQLGPVLSTSHGGQGGSNSNIPGGGSEGDGMENHEKLQSSLLQIKSNDLLAPPATSPFSVLLLKEDQKLKNKHVVKEMPWGGFPSEKLALISKSNYSIRVKVALLTDLALSNVAVKLDMITDLLVIIDSVKGTKGFIVFATTHVPYILDPALRRPGRFNETISLPLIPNLFGRWEILKTNLKHFIKPSFYSWAEPTKQSFSKGITLDLTKSISTARVPVFKGGDQILDSNQILAANLAFRKSCINPLYAQKKIRVHNKLTFNYNLINHAQKSNSGGVHGQSHKNSKPIIDPFQIKKNILSLTPGVQTVIAPISKGGVSPPGFDILNGVLLNKDSILSLIKIQLKGGAYITSTPWVKDKNKYFWWSSYGTTKEKSIALATQTNSASTFTTGPLLKKARKIQNAQILLTVIARAYFSGSQIITSFNSLPKSYKPKGRHIIKHTPGVYGSNPPGVNKPLPNSLGRDAGVYNPYSSTSFKDSFIKPFRVTLKGLGPPHKLTLTKKKSNFIIDQPHKLMSSTDSLLLNSNIYLSLYASPETLKNYLTNLIAGKLGELFISSASGFVPSYKQNPCMGKFAHAKSDSNNFKGNSGLMNLYGIDKSSSDSWTSLLFSIITKRYLSNKNLSISRLLYFSNYSALNDTPAFPTSNILLPLKRYENYRKTFYTQIFENKINFQGKTLQEILELHQQQRFVKRLYKLPLREFFRSEVINNKLTGFANSFITLSSVEKNINCSTNINWYYRNRILNRHRNYLKNQWCNGQLIEHNIESTFLSDIDWRSQCVDSIGDIFIDFPDSDQFYNVQNRRWMLTSTSCKNWLSFEKTNYNATINQYMFDCLIKALHSLDQSREILDFYAFSSFHECMLKDLKEITTISLFKRFSRPL